MTNANGGPVQAGPLLGDGKASLPMYDPPALWATNDGFYQVLAAAVTDLSSVVLPPELIHGQPVLDLWADPLLALSQCCGFDWVQGGSERLALLATPVHDVPGCGPTGTYRSAVVVRAEDPAFEIADLRGRHWVINSTGSYSGCHAWLWALEAEGHWPGAFLGPVSASGGHLESMARVVAGRADYAAIDCLTLALARRHSPDLVAGLRVMAWTQARPMPPLVTRADRPAAEIKALRRALPLALEAPAVQEAARRLSMVGMVAADPGRYWREIKAYPLPPAMVPGP